MTGVLSLDDIAGKAWTLTQLGRNESIPAQPEITLIIDDKQAAGKGACNHYFANVTTSATSGGLPLSQISSTRMACPTKSWMWRTIT